MPNTRTIGRNGDGGDDGHREEAVDGAEASAEPVTPAEAPVPEPVTTPMGAAMPPPQGSPSTAARTPSPVAAPAGGRRMRRGRRVKRVIRRIDLWSVLKLSLVVYTCLYLAILATLAALWSIAYSTGTVDKLQSFLEDVGLENFTFYGNEMFRACAAIGAVGVMAATIVTVLATALVNVISEMTGGIRLVVIEEEPEA